MCKKILITLGTLIVLTGLVVGIRFLNRQRDQAAVFAAPTDEIVIENASLETIAGEGLYLADENERLRLYVNLSDGNIEVVNKENGYVWRSCPTEEEMALENSNALWKNNLRSPVMFTYTTKATSTDTKYTNPLSQESRITVYRLEKGVRVYIEFLESNITFGYDLCLEPDNLKVTVPSYLISDPGEVYKTNANGSVTLDKKASCMIVDFYLFPSLGATRSDMHNAGAMLVPDGSGALMDFNSDKYAASQFISHVYGADMALYNGFDTKFEAEEKKPVANFPVFGVIRDGNTMLAIIDQGETQADIVASKAKVQTGFNTVNAGFVYRMKYKVITNSASGVGYMSYTEAGLQESRCLKYYFGTGNYVDMAKTYRDYLMEKYGLTRMDPQQERAALQLRLLGGDVESGVTGKRFIAMTTFEQAEEILRYFRDQGVGQIDAVYTGWGKWGESVQYPDCFPANAALGGNDGLTALCRAAEEMNARLYLEDNQLLLDSHRGVSVSKNAIYNIQNNPLFDGRFANADFALTNYENSLSHFRRYGVSGIEETGIGKWLISDYSRSSPTSREQMKLSNRAVLQKMRDEFGAVRLASGRAWELMDNALITELEGSSYLTILDQSVPFYTIALHGLVDYLCGDYMNFYEPRDQFLDAIARGGQVSFTLSYEGTEKLALADSAAYYSTEFALWREDVLAVWREMEEYLAETYGQLIRDHVQLQSGVTMTIYENGVSVLVNQTDQPFTTMEGVNVEAKSFLILKGGV